MLRLSNDKLLVELVPEVGGGIASFRASGLDVLRPASPQAIAERNPLGLACFPMTPFANRIAHARFGFLGEQMTIGPPTLPHPLHGYGWHAGWQVDDLTQESAVLSWIDDRSSWPWRYRTEQRVHLEPDALVVDLSVENLAQTPMPASLGLHPYFPDIADACLEAETEGVWLTDADLIPTDWLPASQAPVSFSSARDLAGTDLDNCYTGFGGKARIAWPRLKVEVALEAPSCRFMQVFTRGADGSFCVEAQTAMPDAFNRFSSAGHRPTGLEIVAPGERLGCRTAFRVRRV